MASALVGSPPLLILDEPTTGVDAEQRQLMRKLIREQSASRITLVSSHIVEDLEESCDELLVLDEGELVFQGTVTSLKNLTGLDSLEDAIVQIPRQVREP